MLLLIALPFGKNADAEGPNEETASAESPSVAFVIENLPKRLGERFVEDMAALEAVSAKDGEAAQLTLSKAVQAQVRAGTITLIDKDEDEG